MGELTVRSNEHVIDAHGSALLPGLNDHHVHLNALAAALDSVACGPPLTEVTLATALSEAPGDGWLRGVGYHESVAGDLDRAWLDEHAPHRPIRIQHRSGRLWILNSLALEALSLSQPSDGRLFDADHLLHRSASPPDLSRTSRLLAQYGVTGVTDMTPSNDTATATRIADKQSNGELMQRIRLAGQLAEGIHMRKFHLHDNELPPFDNYCQQIRASHDAGQTIAVHCVTEVDLVFTLAAFREVGAVDGDRIEHASVATPELVSQVRDLGLTVVTQPNFVSERGDAYLQDVPARDHPNLYRCQSFLRANIPLAGGTDTPFGDANPWLAMAAAVHRTTAEGVCFQADEALSAREAYNLFSGALEAPATPRRISIGAEADLVLLDRSWAQACKDFTQVQVDATIVAGRLIYEREHNGRLEDASRQ